jgi:hypothetical protein
MTREQILARLVELEDLLKVLQTTQPLRSNIHEIRDYSRPADASRTSRRSQ